MKPYQLSVQASDDLDNIIEYGVEHFGEVAATNFVERLTKKFELIASNPQLFMPVDHISVGYQRAVFQSYSIFFIERRQYVEIGRVLRKVNFDRIFAD